MENQSKSLIRVKNCLASIPWIFHPRLPRIPWSKVILLTVIWVKIDKQSKILPKILIKTCGLIQLMSLNSFLPSGCGLRSTKPHTKKIFSGCTLESWVCGMCNRVFLFFFLFFFYPLSNVCTVGTVLSKLAYLLFLSNSENCFYKGMLPKLWFYQANSVWGGWLIV